MLEYFKHSIGAMMNSLKVLISVLFVFYLSLNIVHAEIYDGPIADAHAHLPKSVSEDYLASVYKKAGVNKGVIFVGTFNQSRLRSIKNTLGKGFLVFADVHKGKRSGYSLKNKRLSEMVGLYKSGVLDGLGEIYISLSYAPFARNGIRTDIRSYDERKFLQKANSLGIPINLHHETPDKAFSKTLIEFPNITFILAHSGYLEPFVLDDLLSKHTNLYADLSLITNYHFGPFKDAPKLGLVPSKAWKNLLIKHQDRFMVGSDIGAMKERVDKLPEIIEDYRKLLGNMPREVAHNIAYKNFERLLLK